MVAIPARLSMMRGESYSYKLQLPFMKHGQKSCIAMKNHNPAVFFCGILGEKEAAKWKGKKETLVKLMMT